MERVCESTQTKIPCPHCNYLFSNRDDLKRHLKNSCPGLKEQEREREKAERESMMLMMKELVADVKTLKERPETNTKNTNHNHNYNNNLNVMCLSKNDDLLQILT